MRSLRSPSGVPEAPGAVPLLGHIPVIARDRARWLSACRAADDVVAVRLGTRRAYLVCAPRLVDEVLVGQVAVFDKGGPVLDRLRDVAGTGLATARHEEHRHQRPVLQPAFSPSHIASYSQAIGEECEALVAGWQPHRRILVLSETQKLAAAVLARARRACRSGRPPPPAGASRD
ncbi:cytochrome P450 [Kitasatospora sp. NPDC056783]|uniref:cytochrome P450 n=1 Tax=Kitasatospora sp. NPDC056783 TaxID=3345943 RepID=UPI0036C4AF85